MYAHVIGDTITAVVSSLPATASPNGWYEVVPAERPTDDDTHTHIHSISLVEGVPTLVWARQPRSDADINERRLDANHRSIDKAIVAALQQLQQIIDAPPVADVPDGTLTAAQLSNGLRQIRNAVQANRDAVQVIARTLRQAIRLLRSDFDATD